MAVKGFYNNALQEAEADLKRAISEQEEIEEKAEALKEQIAQLRRVVAGLAEYCGRPVENWAGPTEVLTQVMERATEAMDVKDILAAVKATGFEIGGKNPAATVTSILNRLAARDTVTKVTTANGTLWVGKNVGVVTDDDIPF